MTFNATQTDPNVNWVTTATFPLSGTSAANPGETAAEEDVWIPTAPVGATQTVDPITSPDFNLSAADPNSSLTTAGSDSTPTNWNCGPYTISNQLSPNLGVITSASGATSILVDWLGNAFPSTNSGNANSSPPDCDTDELADFEMATPLIGGDGPTSGEPQFDIPWASGYDTIRFAFSGVSATAATQTLPGTDESETAASTGRTDSNLNCINGNGYTCTESYSNTSETLTLTKVCSGTVTVENGIVGGSCGSSPPPPPPGKAPSDTRITKSKFNARKHDASFTFKANGATSYQCALVEKPKKGHKAPKLEFHSCKSPKSYSHLKKGHYTFEVRGVNATGEDPHPASKSFKIG